MKSAKKILSVFLAVLMLFSVMSVGFGGIVAIAHTVTVDGAADDTYETTDDVIIAVPETIYMKPGDNASTTGQYFVNNIVDRNGRVSVTAEKSQTNGSISIWAPGSTAFSFKTTAITGGIGDPVICNPDGGATFEDIRWANTDVGGTTGYASYALLALNINGTGLWHGSIALVEWEVTVYYGDADTTGKTYYAYTTLYAPMRSVGAIAEAKRSDNTNNEISSWISGVTGVGSPTAVTSNRADKEATGYFKYDPLWTNTFGGGSYNSADDFIVQQGNFVHASAPDGAGYTFSAGYTGYLMVDSSRYTNTNQIPNFYIGSDALRIESTALYYGLGKYYIWSKLGTGTERTTTDQDYNPASSDGWTQLYFADKGELGRKSWNPEYAVSDIAGKYLHIGSQGRANYLSQYDYSNAYVSVVFSVTDKSDLRAAIIQATSLDGTKYTKNSWTGASDTVVDEFRDALRNAAEVLGNPAADQGSIDGALGALRAKMNALKVTIKFDASTNGGVFTDNKTVKEYDVQFGTKKLINIGASLLNYFPVARFGYEFAGWSTDPDDPASASLSSLAGITFGDTLYAHYKKTISVDFHFLADASGKTDVTSNELTIYNQEDKALDVNVEDADDVDVYKFAGWTQDPASTEGSALGDTLTGITANTVYYATYLKTLTLNLDANGGDFDKASVEGGVGYNYDLTQSTGVATVILPETAPTRTGYGFDGWEINGEIYQPGDEVEFTGTATTATATAVWTINKFNVTFNFKDENGNDVSIKEKIEYGNAAQAPEIPDYYANQTMHYKFTNWDKSFDNITGDIVITAVYASGTMHNFTYTGNLPTCEEAGEAVYTCSVCGYSYTYSGDALGHEYVITDSKDADCENDGYITYVCNRDASHTYTEIIPATGHSFENTEYVAPTCTEDGYYISGTCANCGEDLAGKVIPALGHSWEVETEATCEHPGLKVCTVCGETDVIPQLPHSYVAVTIPATCEEDGKIVYTCSECGHSYETVIKSDGHNHIQMVIAPTCTSQGYTSLVCTVCGESTRSNYVPALGHDYTSVVVEPTCTTQGYTKHTCAVCGYSYKTDIVDALGHKYDKETVVDPTCTTKGYILHECTVCGSSYKTDFVDALGHDYQYVGSQTATATTPGYDLYECSVCHHTYKQVMYTAGKALISKTLKDTLGAIIVNATVTFTNKETGNTIVIKTDANGYFTYVFPEGDYEVAIAGGGCICDETGSLFVELGTASLNLPSITRNTCDCLCHQNTLWARIYKLFIKLFSIFGRIYCCDCSEIWS